MRSGIEHGMRNAGAGIATDRAEAKSHSPSREVTGGKHRGTIPPYENLWAGRSSLPWVSTRSGLLVTSCVRPRGPRGVGSRRRMRNLLSHLCIRAGPEHFSMAQGRFLRPPADGGTYHRATVFPASLLNRCERVDGFVLSRENLMTWYCGAGYSAVTSPPSATRPARPEIAHPSGGGSGTSPVPGSPVQEGVAPGIFTPAALFLRNPVAQAPLGRGVPACTDG